MRKIRALHIASFNGNIGDNANHNGLRKNLMNILDSDISFDEVEMREFYQSWNLRDFNNNDFINLCNQYDFIIIGGGNFFELKWDYSHTGTTVNISNETLSKIKTPILFFGLGCDIGKGCSENTIEKFGVFLDRITTSSQFFVTVRNDGSFETIEKLYGKKYSKKILKVADGAFFLETDDANLATIKEERKLVGINVACDMKSIRFNKEVSYNQFVDKFAKLLNGYLKNNMSYDLMFFPHIYSDLEAISDVIKNIDDKYRRYRITVAPYLNGKGAERYIFGLYKKCEVILGMRFHSNVCAIAQNTPTIALNSYKKIHDLYKELDLLDRLVNVNEEGFESLLDEKLNYTIQNKRKMSLNYQKINEDMLKNNNIFLKKFKKWFRNKVEV